MSEQVGSVTCKKSSDFHGRIRFQSRFTIRWELEDKNFLKIDIRAVYTRENKPRLTLAAAYIRRERKHLYQYGLY